MDNTDKIKKLEELIVKIYSSNTARWWMKYEIQGFCSDNDLMHLLKKRLHARGVKCRSAYESFQRDSALRQNLKCALHCKFLRSDRILQVMA